MGLYTNNLNGYGFGSTSFESLEEDTSLNINEGMSLMEAAINSVALIEENWNAIQREIALTELAYAEEYGTEFVYTEATGTGFIAKAKEFFKNIWEKIKALFRKFLIILGSYTKDDKEFVRKYSKDITAAMKNIPSDATFKGYKYTLPRWAEYVDAVGGLFDIAKTVMGFSEVGEALYKAYGSYKNYDHTEVLDKTRGELLGKSNTGVDASEFNQFIFEVLRNDQDSKDDMDLTAGLVNTAMGELQNMKTIRKEASKAYKGLEKIFKNFDKDLENANKDIVKKMPTAKNEDAEAAGVMMTGINRILAVSKGAAASLQTGNGIFLTACKEASRQYKAICVRVVTYKNIKESSDYGDSFGENADMFAGVVLR